MFVLFWSSWWVGLGVFTASDRAGGVGWGGGVKNKGKKRLGER